MPNRRRFLKETATVLTSAMAAEALAAEPARPADIVAALGDVIIPTDGPDYPGYRRLEAHGISNRVLNQLRFLDHVTPTDLALFNESAAKVTGKSFLESDAAGRASYLEALFADRTTEATVQRVLKLARERILTVFYRNFPYDTVERDEHGVPIPNKPHEIFDYKKGDLVTGWDIAGYRGPLSWEEEEQRRSRFQKILWSPPAWIILAWVALASVAVRAQDRFPDAEEKEQVTTTCSACHPLSRVAANHRTETQWAQTVKVHEGRGLKLDPEDAKPIVRYLAAYFGPLVNLNTATAAEIAELPGVTKKMADTIVQYRERHGPFQKVDDVAGVEGFPTALLPKIRNRLSK